MKIEIKLDAKKEPFFIERRRITSGRIARSGFEEYGVVFSGIGKPNEVSEEPPADLTAAESDFQVAHLQSAMVGWRSASDFDDHLYFEILGGYFYHQGNEKDGQTSKVFGIASEPAFGVKENGKTTINDNWALVEPSTRGLDEKEGRGGGWTFIVRWKDGGEFPHSSTQLKICFENPEIELAAATIGDCVPDMVSKQLLRKVSLQAKIKAAVPKNWTWHFGDGKEQSGDGTPPESVDHLYAKALQAQPRLVVTCTHPLGQEASMEADLSAFTVCPECPQIESASANVGDCKDDKGIIKREVTFSIITTGGVSTKWSWDFGDGHNESGDGAPPASITHLYENTPASTPKLTVQGEAPCQSVSAEVSIVAFKACAQCPVIDSVAARIGDCKDDGGVMKRDVTFSSSTSGGTPTEWSWDFGDGSSKSGEGTPPNSLTHLYEKEPASTPKLTVHGESPCQRVSKETTMVDFKPCPQCPKISSFVAEFGDCVRDAQQNKLRKEVTFKIAVAGSAVQTWQCDFGDGKTDSGTGAPPANLKHLYAGAPAQPPKLTIEGQEEPCEKVMAEADLSAFEPCPPCPQVRLVTARTVHEDDKITTCEFRIETEDGVPTQFEWDFGDGSPRVKSTDPVTTHAYKRGDRDMRIVASVDLTGPHTCSVSAQKQIDIPKAPVQPPEPPKPPVRPCLWLQLLTAFFASLALGCLTLRIAAGTFHPEVDASDATIAILIFAVMAVLGVVWWQSFIKKRLCEPIGSCQIKGIIWTAMLSAGLVALYISNCCPAGWWGAIFLLFAAAGFVLFNWLKTCKANTRAMLLHIVTALVAAFLVSIFIARAILEACL